MQFGSGAGKHSRVLDAPVCKPVGVHEGEELLLRQHLILFFCLL
jgi:hypothetical protein